MLVFIKWQSYSCRHTRRMVFAYMCEYLGVSPKEFFDYEAENPVALKELVDMQKVLSPIELESVKGVVESIANLKGYKK